MLCEGIENVLLCGRDSVINVIEINTCGLLLPKKIARNLGINNRVHPSPYCFRGS